MNCIVQAILYSAEQLGFYEPELDIFEANTRLAAEKAYWQQFPLKLFPLASKIFLS